jgi:hypothetical protein
MTSHPKGRPYADLIANGIIADGAHWWPALPHDVWASLLFAYKNQTLGHKTPSQPLVSIW